MDAGKVNPPAELKLDVTKVGFELVKEYFAALNDMPEQAWCFYANHGNYCTQYPDGSFEVASNWKELRRMLLRPITTDDNEDIEVTSVITIPYISANHLLVMATGDRFIQTFLFEYRPAENQSYAIVASITKYSSPETAERRPPTKTPVNGRSCLDNIAAEEAPAVTAPNRPPVGFCLSFLDNLAADLPPTEADANRTPSANIRREPKVNRHVLRMSPLPEKFRLKEPKFLPRSNP